MASGTITNLAVKYIDKTVTTSATGTVSITDFRAIDTPDPHILLGFWVKDVWTITDFLLVDGSWYVRIYDVNNRQPIINETFNVRMYYI